MSESKAPYAINPFPKHKHEVRGKTPFPHDVLEKLIAEFEEDYWKITIQSPAILAADNGRALIEAAAFSYRACYAIFPAKVILGTFWEEGLQEATTVVVQEQTILIEYHPLVNEYTALCPMAEQ